MSENRILAALAESRRQVSFETPEGLRVLGEQLYAYAPTAAQWDEASAVEIGVVAASKLPETGGAHVLVATALCRKRGRRAMFVHLVARCVHYRDASGELRPLGDAVVASMQEGDVAALCDQLEEAVNLADPQVEELTQGEYEDMVEVLKKKDSRAIADTLKSTGIATLRSFTLSLVSELRNSGTSKFCFTSPSAAN